MTARRLGLALVATVVAVPAVAKDEASEGPGARIRPVATLDAVPAAFRSCWHPPAGLAGLERIIVTARFGLRTDGSLIGEPRMTYSTLSGDAGLRALLERSVRAAIRACSPIPITASLGRAIAGRPIVIRFTHHGPQGQGV